MAKSSSTVPVPSMSLQGSSLGRVGMNTYDGRYSSKDSAGKRVSLRESFRISPKFFFLFSFFIFFLTVLILEGTIKSLGLRCIGRRIIGPNP